MSSTIKLYEHNQKAYDALLDMLGERDRACVIKPTGTGKFVILAKMVQDNPDKRFLLLGTNDYMFNDQMANLAEIAPGFTPENLHCICFRSSVHQYLQLTDLWQFLLSPHQYMPVLALQ